MNHECTCGAEMYGTCHCAGWSVTDRVEGILLSATGATVLVSINEFGDEVYPED